MLESHCVVSKTGIVWPIDQMSGIWWNFTIKAFTLASGCGKRRQIELGWCKKSIFRRRSWCSWHWWEISGRNFSSLVKLLCKRKARIFSDLDCPKVSPQSWLRCSGLQSDEARFWISRSLLVVSFLDKKFQDSEKLWLSSRNIASSNFHVTKLVLNLSLVHHVVVGRTFAYRFDSSFQKTL